MIALEIVESKLDDSAAHILTAYKLTRYVSLKSVREPGALKSVPE